MIACIYIEEFPAWTLRKRIKESAYVVVGSNYVVGASSRAKFAGVETGMTVSRAQGLLQNLKVVPYDASRDEWVWKGVLKKLYELTPQIEHVQHGLAFVEHISKSELITLCQKWNIQGGMSNCRSYAHLAAIKSGKGNVLSVHDENKRYFLANVKPELLKLLSFPEEVTEKLPLFGLNTLDKVFKLTDRNLTAQFGMEGKKLYQLLHPSREEKPVALYTPEKWIGEKLKFDITTNNTEEVRNCLYDQLCNITTKLATRNAGSLRLMVEWKGKKITSSRRLQRPTNVPKKLLSHAMTMFSKMDKPEAPIDAVGIALGNFTAPKSRQVHLFERPNVYGTKKSILERYPCSLINVKEEEHSLFPEDQLKLVPIHL